MEEFGRAIVDFVRAHQAWAIPIVFVLAFGESLAFFSLILPASVILFSIGGLLGAGGIGFWPAWMAAGIGGTLGYAVSYWIGLYFKDSLHRIWPFTKRPDLLPRGQAFFEKYGVLGVFLGHFFGPVRAVVPVVAGMYAMPQIPFQIANVSSAFIWSAVVLAPGLVGLRYWLGE